jgi:phage shock protein E
MKITRVVIEIVKLSVFALIIAALIPCSCFQGIAPKKLVQEWISRGALIVDVRTPGEYNSGHYNGAINIPLADIEKNIAGFGDRKRLIVLYCRSGNRSGKAKLILENNGFTDVINGGGLKDMP